MWRINHFVHYCALYTPLVGHFDALIQVQTGCFRTRKPEHLITKQALLFQYQGLHRGRPRVPTESGVKPIVGAI